MPSEKPLILVFTDELGSAKRDAKLLSDYQLSGNIADLKIGLCESRRLLFERQIENLSAFNSGKVWTIVKTVGDALIMSLDVKSEDGLREAVQDCIASLLSVWVASGKTIRVACHLTWARHVITKDELRAN